MKKKLWWLSFADPELPVGKRFKGVCIVEADDLSSAADRAWELKCNPGGEVRGVEVREALAKVIPEKQRGVLLNASEATELNRRLVWRVTNAGKLARDGDH